MVDLKELSEVLFRGDVSRVKEIILRALQEKKDPKDILEQGLIKGMNVPGLITSFLKCHLAKDSNPFNFPSLVNNG